MRSFIKVSLLALLALCLAVPASAGWKPEVVLGPGVGSGQTPWYVDTSLHLSADTLYHLTGICYVESLATLTIEPGTVVVGDSAGTFVVQRGAQIFAEGTPERPIVFTSDKAPGERTPGDWGGVVLLGDAPCNKVNPVIEGGLIEGTFGGNNPNHDIGVFKYCRIEFPGERLEEGNEVNGLTMGAIGDQSEVHHVQVSYSDDDSYEWFGGTVDHTHLVVLGGTDDVFDTDFGYRGRLQYLFCARDRFYWDPTGQSNGYESDNDGSGSEDPPITGPTFSNMTMCGPAPTDTTMMIPGNSFQFSGVIRRCSQLKSYNGVIMGWPWGLSVRDECTYSPEDMKFRYMALQAWELEPGSSCVHQEDKWAGVQAWYDSEPGNNPAHSLPRLPSSVGLTDMSDINDPNPIPLPGSELTAGADFSELDTSFFEVTTYRGAFDPTRGMDQQWTAMWTNFDPQNTVYDEEAVGVDEFAKGSMSQNYPNPFNPVTKIAFSTRQAGNVTIEVYNAAGKVVRTLLNDEMPAGHTGYVTWDGMDDAGQKCASGVYFYSITAPDYAESHKMVMLK